jgi:hypothetical protein
VREMSFTSTLGGVFQSHLVEQRFDLADSLLGIPLSEELDFLSELGDVLGERGGSHFAEAFCAGDSATTTTTAN